MYKGRKLYYQSSTTAISKLYSNTLLVFLNSRMQLISEEDIKERDVQFSAIVFDTSSVLEGNVKDTVHHVAVSTSHE